MRKIKKLKLNQYSQSDEKLKATNKTRNRQYHRK